MAAQDGAAGGRAQDAGATGAKREEVMLDDHGAAGRRAAQGDGVGAAGGRAAQDVSATAAPEDVQSLLVQWSLESYAGAFEELGLQRVSDLKYMEDAHVGELHIPVLAKCKTRAMLAWWREEKRKEAAQGAGATGALLKREEDPARKKVKREEGAKREEGVKREREEGGGQASGGAKR
ncbi:hypothetical protein T484DRAFT_2021835 [Baffinella frigidus]|nr:hypothetical protein T484DRAFT_2021835 [Cryptophyta sp. CCMP2293]